MKSKDKTKTNPFLGKEEAEQRQTELSADFQPDGWNVAYARRHGLDVNWETSSFIDFYGSLGTQAANWQGMFHNWLVKAAADHGRIRVPDWVPPSEWEAFLEVRQSLGKLITPAVQRLLLKRLQQLRDEGDSAAGVLEQSIMGSYVNLYPVR